MRKLAPLPAICFIFIALALPAAAEEPLARTETVFWTTCTITLYDHASRENLDAVFARLREIDRRMSVNVPDSELDKVSAAAGHSAVRVSPDVMGVVKKMLWLSSISEGLFDPTVGPLMKAWSMNTEHGRIPAPADLQKARALVNWHDVLIDEAHGTVFLKRSGMRLDAGGVLKGYAADEAVRVLAAHGVRSAIVDLGGDIFAMGGKPDGSPWRIGVQNPDAARDVYFGTVDVRNKSVVTSGVYEHYFIQNGRRYHHIMDTRTGFPVDNGLTAVTVIADSSLDADGLGLSLFCLGPDKGIPLAERLGVDAVMVGADHLLYATAGARKLLVITDPGFRYASP